METKIQAERKGRKWVATGTIPGQSRLIAPQGNITRIAKNADPEVAIDAVEDALTLAKAYDAAAATVERAELEAEVIRTGAQKRVEEAQASRFEPEPTVIERVVAV